jgi:hypothetical protein
MNHVIAALAAWGLVLSVWVLWAAWRFKTASAETVPGTTVQGPSIPWVYAISIWRPLTTLNPIDGAPPDPTHCFWANAWHSLHWDSYRDAVRYVRDNPESFPPQLAGMCEPGGWCLTHTPLIP